MGTVIFGIWTIVSYLSIVLPIVTAFECNFFIKLVLIAVFYWFGSSNSLLLKIPCLAVWIYGGYKAITLGALWYAIVYWVIFAIVVLPPIIKMIKANNGN